MSAQRQLLYYVSQSGRQPKFAITTSIYQDDDSRHVAKQSMGGESLDHLHAMLASYGQLNVLIDKIPGLDIVIPSKLDSGVEFPFIKGVNIERKLLRSMLGGDEGVVKSIINKLLSIVDSLPTTICNPVNNPEYKKVFGKNFNREVECVIPGIADLNLDNFIESAQGEWTLIDYEWVFNFPLPKQYITSRFFAYFFLLKYQDILRYHADTVHQLEVVRGYGVPQYIIDSYENYFEHIPEAMNAESAFQKYVQKSHHSEDDVNYEYIHPTERDTVPRPAQLVPEFIRSREEISRLSNKLIELERNHRETHDKLERVELSGPYKVAKKLSQVKHLVSRLIKG
ncbi:MAG: hypothetical protein WD467_02135 [Candidatus Saccharimonadales bacterium]